MKKTLLPLIAGLLFLHACQSSQNSGSEATADLEAREDSLELLAAYQAQELIEWSVTASLETAPIKAASLDDAADDPAIWLHPEDRSRSLIYCSNKRGGLAAYDLQGNEVAYYPIGNINNVDILYGFPSGDSLITILGCSNRSDQSIDLFAIDPANGALVNIADGPLAVDSAKIDDIYGFCFAQDLTDGKNYAVINGKNGRLQQFEMKSGSNGIQLDLSREVLFDSQTEGMVADNELGFLYVGEEDQGIWKLSIDPTDTTPKRFLKLSGEENPNIRYDVEGLSIYKNGAAGYLVASSQGNFSYAIFDRTGDNAYLASFKIIASETLDGVEETDGLDIVADSLSPAFPKGMIALQDGFNYDGDSLKAQNLKLVSWDRIAAFLEK